MKRKERVLLNLTQKWLPRKTAMHWIRFVFVLSCLTVLHVSRDYLQNLDAWWYDVPCDMNVGLGSWVGSEYKELRQCTRQPLNQSKQCLKHMSILFVGNSHLRLLVPELLALQGVRVPPSFVTNRHKSDTVFIEETKTRVSFIFTEFQYTFLGHEAVAEKWYDVVVMNHGVWHMHYWDMTQKDYMNRVRNDFRKVRHKYPKARYIVMNMHRVHRPPNFFHFLTTYELCANEKRQQSYRNMITCVANEVFGVKYEMMDFFAMTNTTHAHEEVARDGHHYREGGTVMQFKIQVMLDGLCRPPMSPDIWGSPAPSVPCSSHFHTFRPICACPQGLCHGRNVMFIKWKDEKATERNIPKYRY